MPLRFIYLTAWSIGVAGTAWLAGAVADSALHSLNVDHDAVVVVSAVATALWCLLGCRFTANRLDAHDLGEVVFVTSGPAVLGATWLVRAEPFWFRLVAAAGIGLAAAVGVVLARRDRSHPLDTHRPFP